MIDTHTHLYMPEFDDADGQPADSYAGQCQAVDRAVAAGVSMMILPNVDCSTMAPLKALHALRSANTAMAMGLHPTEVTPERLTELDTVIADITADPSRYVAVGEVGIDLYWDKQYEREQMAAFDRQAALAVQLGLPLIIHCREGLGQVLEVMQGHPQARAVFHSFGGSEADVDLIRRCGDYYFGINGIVTFKNSRLREVLPHIGADRLLTETDSPYLAPAPHRGTRNESARIPLILNAMAAALGMEPAALDAATTNNAKSLFKL